MSIQVLRIHITVQSDSGAAIVPFGKPVLKERKNNRLIAFFSRFHPSNWFSEFKDIKISLEEFGNKHE